MTKTKEVKCVICKGNVIGYGNNPSPVKSRGVCCNECNTKFVIPARIYQIIANK